MRGAGSIDVGETGLTDNRPMFFVAKITGSSVRSTSGAPSGSTGAYYGEPHAWIEMTPARAGGYEEMPGGRRGNAELNPAFELNGNVVAADTLVFMRERGIVGSQAGYERGTVFDFLSPFPEDGAASGSDSSSNYIDVVTNVCLIDSSASGSTSLSTGEEPPPPP